METLKELETKREELEQKANNYVKLQSEGYETFKLGLTDSPYDAEIRQLNAKINQIKDADFFAKWTKEYTDEQKQIWNTACKSGKYKNPADIKKATKIDYSSMIVAIEHYKELVNA